MFAGMIARPRAISSRTNSGFIPSRTATNSISSVICPRRANSICVTIGPPRRDATHGARSFGSPVWTSLSRGPLVSYTRSGGSSPASAISRIGTRTPRGPFTYTFDEFGNAPG